MGIACGLELDDPEAEREEIDDEGIAPLEIDPEELEKDDELTVADGARCVDISRESVAAGNGLDPGEGVLRAGAAECECNGETCCGEVAGDKDLGGKMTGAETRGEDWTGE
jgi:hypothetical protein